MIAILDGNMKPVNPSNYRKIKLKLIDPENMPHLFEIVRNINQFTLEQTVQLSSKTGIWQAYVGIDGNFEQVLKFQVKESKLSPFKVFIEPSRQTFGLDDVMSATIYAQHTAANTFVHGIAKLTYSIYDPNYLDNAISKVKGEDIEISRKKLLSRNMTTLSIPKDLMNAIVKLEVEVTEVDSKIVEKSETFFLIQQHNFVIKNLNFKQFFVHGNRFDFTAEIENLDGTFPQDQILKVDIEESYIDDCKIYDAGNPRPTVQKYVFKNNINLVDGKLTVSFRPSAQTKRLKIVVFYNSIEKSFVIPEIPIEPSEIFDMSVITLNPRIGKPLSAVITSKIPIGQLNRFSFSEYGYIKHIRDRVDDNNFAFNMETSKASSNFLFVEQANSLKFSSLQVGSNQVQNPEYHTKNSVRD